MGFRNLVPHMSGWSTTGGLSGKSYVAGGEETGSVVIADTDAFDQPTNTWASLTSLTVATRMHAFFPVGDTAFAAGGQPAGYSTDVYRFCHLSNLWLTRTDMPAVARVSIAACSVNGFGFVFGGQDIGTARTNDLDEFTPSLNVWASEADMIGANRAGAAAAAVGNYAFIFGGFDSAAIATTDQYDQSVGVWTNMGDAGVSLWGRVAQEIGNQVYVFGGLTYGGTPQADAERYTPSTNTWYTLSPLAEARGTHCGSSRGQKGLIYGGEDSGSNYSVDCLQYSAVGDSWNSRTNLVAPGRRYAGSATISATRSVLPNGLKVGGYDGLNYKTVEKYTRPTNTWASMTNALDSRRFASMGSVGIYAYVVGSAGYTAAHSRYSVLFDAWAVMAEQSAPARRSVGAISYGAAWYAMSGRDATPAVNADCSVYTVGLDSWAFLADIGTARDLHAANEAGGDLFALAGRDATPTNLKTIEKYTISGDSWAAVTDAPAPIRRGPVGFTVDNDIYLVGGDNAGALTDNDKYVASTDTWSSPTALVAPGRYWAAGYNLDLWGHIVGGYTGAATLADLDEYEAFVDAWANRADVATGAYSLGGESV